MKKNSLLKYLAAIALLPAALFVSCGKEAGKPAPTTAKAVNPYSSESVFDEVKKTLEKEPNNIDALFHLADLYERNSQYKEAVDTYNSILKIKPDMGYVHFKTGTAYDRLNQPEEAVREFRKAAKYIPKNPVLYNNMGVAYGKLGKCGEEISALKKAIKLRPSYSSARYNLGMTYLKTKNKKAAMKTYEELKEFDEGAAGSLLKEINSAS